MSSNIVHYNTYPGLSTLNSPVNLPPYTDGALPAANRADDARRQPNNHLHPPTGTEGDRDSDVPEFMLPPPLLSEEEALAEFEAWKRATGMSTVVVAQRSGTERMVSMEELLNPVNERRVMSREDPPNPVNNDRVKEMMSISALLNAVNTGT